MARPTVLRNEVAHPADNGGLVRGAAIWKPNLKRDGTRMLAHFK
jgi:hypothetical protein